MNFELRAWRASDAKNLAAALSNPKILNNLRDGIPYPYTEGDAVSYIGAMQRVDPHMAFAYAVQEFTVNSSPYAVDIYRQLDFVPTDTEQITNGIRYMPMRFEGGQCKWSG